MELNTGTLPVVSAREVNVASELVAEELPELLVTVIDDIPTDEPALPEETGTVSVLAWFVVELEKDPVVALSEAIEDNDMPGIVVDSELVTIGDPLGVSAALAVTAATLEL